jgi:hypothetical protein
MEKRLLEKYLGIDEHTNNAGGLNRCHLIPGSLPRQRVSSKCNLNVEPMQNSLNKCNAVYKIMTILLSDCDMTG